MKIVFTPTGGAAATLVDDSVKQVGHIERWGGRAIIDKKPLYGATFQSLFANGNTIGEFAFSAEVGYASRTLSMQGMATEYARIGQAGALVVTQDSAIITMAGAMLENVTLGKPNGLRFEYHYSFVITTVVSS